MTNTPICDPLLDPAGNKSLAQRNAHGVSNKKAGRAVLRGRPVIAIGMLVAADGLDHTRHRTCFL